MLYKSLMYCYYYCLHPKAYHLTQLSEHLESCIHNPLRFVLRSQDPAQCSGFPETYAFLVSLRVWHIWRAKGLSPKSRSSLLRLELPQASRCSHGYSRLGTLLATLGSYWSGMHTSSAWTKRAPLSHRSCWMSARVQGYSFLWKLSEISKLVVPRCRKPKND